MSGNEQPVRGNAVNVVTPDLKLFFAAYQFSEKAYAIEQGGNDDRPPPDMPFEKNLLDEYRMEAIPVAYMIWIPAAARSIEDAAIVAVENGEGFVQRRVPKNPFGQSAEKSKTFVVSPEAKYFYFWTCDQELANATWNHLAENAHDTRALLEEVQRPPFTSMIANLSLLRFDPTGSVEPAEYLHRLPLSTSEEFKTHFRARSGALVASHILQNDAQMAIRNEKDLAGPIFSDMFLSSALRGTMNWKVDLLDRKWVFFPLKPVEALVNYVSLVKREILRRERNSCWAWYWINAGRTVATYARERVHIPELASELDTLLKKLTVTEGRSVLVDATLEWVRDVADMAYKHELGRKKAGALESLVAMVTRKKAEGESDVEAEDPSAFQVTFWSDAIVEATRLDGIDPLHPPTRKQVWLDGLGRFYELPLCPIVAVFGKKVLSTPLDHLLGRWGGTLVDMVTVGGGHLDLSVYGAELTKITELCRKYFQTYLFGMYLCGVPRYVSGITAEVTKTSKAHEEVVERISGLLQKHFNHEDFLADTSRVTIGEPKAFGNRMATALSEGGVHIWKVGPRSKAWYEKMKSSFSEKKPFISVFNGSLKYYFGVSTAALTSHMLTKYMDLGDAAVAGAVDEIVKGMARHALPPSQKEWQGVFVAVADNVAAGKGKTFDLEIVSGDTRVTVPVQYGAGLESAKDAKDIMGKIALHSTRRWSLRAVPTYLGGLVDAFGLGLTIMNIRQDFDKKGGFALFSLGKGILSTAKSVTGVMSILVSNPGTKDLFSAYAKKLDKIGKYGGIIADAADLVYEVACEDSGTQGARRGGGSGLRGLYVLKNGATVGSMYLSALELAGLISGGTLLLAGAGLAVFGFVIAKVISDCEKEFKTFEDRRKRALKLELVKGGGLSLTRQYLNELKFADRILAS